MEDFVKSPDCIDLDDDWDPMREDFENVEVNSYDQGPGAYLETHLQRPTHRDKNNQVVFKLMVNRIPNKLSKVGLLNLFGTFGKPTLVNCSRDGLTWALIEFRTLQEAERAIKALDSSPPFEMRVHFARSDEENERFKKLREQDKLFHQQVSAKVSNQPDPSPRNETESSIHPVFKKLGRGVRGSVRGRLIMSAYRDSCARRAGSRTCMWSDGNPDIRDPGNLIYKGKHNPFDATNKYIMQNIVVSCSSSARKVAMGRAFVPPYKKPPNQPSTNVPLQIRIGEDIEVPLLPCSKCGADTVQKCFQCGTPYCSRTCQRADFVRHKPTCKPRDSIDVVFNQDSQQKTVPLTRKIAKVDPLLSCLQNNLFWGKPENSAISKLRWGTTAVVEIKSFKSGQFSGALSCEEVFDTQEKLWISMQNSLSKTLIRNPSFWPIVGTLVAVRCENSVWRGYVLNAPIIGSSSKYTIALCDLGKIETVQAKDVFALPSEYHNLPELGVTCRVVGSLSAVHNSWTEGSTLSLKVETSTDTKATAQILSPEGTVLGQVVLTPWEPHSVMELTPVPIVPPCEVVLTAYYSQHALYVRPTGRLFQEQFFSLIQKVATVHVTSPPLRRAPYKEEMLACRFKKDGNFYRAVVFGESQTTPNEYSAFFVDFGNNESVSLHDLKDLPDDLKKHPCMAVKVSLKNVRDGPLNENAVQFLNMLLQKEQQLQLECSNYSDQGVELICLRDKSSINSQLNQLLMPDWEVAQKEGLKPHRGEVFMLDEYNKVLPLVEGKTGMTTIFVSSILSDCRLAACPTEQTAVEHVLQTLTYQITEYCESTDHNDRYNPRVNELCLAKYKDGIWYRAVNIQTLSDSCHVLFLDFGNEEEVEFKHIRRMVQDFVTFPTIMSMCYIDGLPETPSVEMLKRVKELVQVNKPYEVQVLKQTSVGEYKIHLPEISNQLKSEFCV